MGRAVPRDFEYNREYFVLLLLQAKGKLSLKAFAEECNVSIAWLSKTMNGRLDEAPTPWSIKKIANYTTKFGVTENMLLDAAGYDCRKYSSDYKDKEENAKIKKIFDMVLLDPIMSDEKSSVRKTEEETPYDLCVVKEKPIWHKCFFKYLYKKDYGFSNFNNLKSDIITEYGKLLCGDVLKEQKRTELSFVTDSTDIFNYIKDIIPYGLMPYITINAYCVDISNYSCESVKIR